MREDIIWELRSDKVKEILRSDKRIDGRKFDEYRPVDIRLDISKNAHGSSIVRLGETQVMCGVMIVPGTPYPDSPDQGSISVGAELMPLASPTFEVGPPREEATELARVVDRGIREGKAVDFKKLCITEGELAWVVFIDLYIANDAGNMLDASAIAAMAALLNARVPKLEDKKVVKGEFAGKLEIERQPMLCTFAKVGTKILADPLLAEEKAMDARFSVATTEDDFLSAFQKGGAGSFTAAEIEQCVDWSFKLGKQLRKKVTG